MLNFTFILGRDVSCRKLLQLPIWIRSISGKVCKSIYLRNHTELQKGVQFESDKIHMQCCIMFDFYVFFQKWLKSSKHVILLHFLRIMGSPKKIIMFFCMPLQIFRFATIQKQIFAAWQKFCNVTMLQVENC